jgi:hypothetical protein
VTAKAVHACEFLIVIAGFVFLVCLSLVKLAWELSQVSIHSPDILEIPTKPLSAKDRPAKAELAGSQLKG